MTERNEDTTAHEFAALRALEEHLPWLGQAGSRRVLEWAQDRFVEQPKRDAVRWRDAGISLRRALGPYRRGELSLLGGHDV